MADWTGKRIGKVQIHDLIARGGMAEIYLADHEVYGQVAVKVMRGLLERDVMHLARFQREAEAASAAPAAEAAEAEEAGEAAEEKPAKKPAKKTAAKKTAARKGKKKEE